MTTNDAKGILENPSRGMPMAEWKMSPPPLPLVSKRSAASAKILGFLFVSFGESNLTIT